jgi:hypothetical protein
MPYPNVFRTLVCDATDQTIMQETAIAVWGDPAKGMFTVGCSPDGSLPATQFISTGIVEAVPQAAQLPATLNGQPHAGSAAAIRQLLVDAGYNYTLGKVRSALNASDISDVDPWTVMADLGIQPVSTPI